MSRPPQVAPIKSDSARIEISMWERKEWMLDGLLDAHKKVWSWEFTARFQSLRIRVISSADVVPYLHCENVFVFNVNCYHPELPMKIKLIDIYTLVYMLKNVSL